MIRPINLPEEQQHFRYQRRDFQHSPLVAFYEVTQACDLECQHCRACAQPTADPCELSPKESARLVNQLASFPKPPLLVLTGGDPLKRADIFELIRHAKDAGLSVAITPSATSLLTSRAIVRLRDVGISRLAISLDGALEATHDALRGVPGSFLRTLDVLVAARELGMATQVNTTLTQSNIDELDQIADFIAPCDIALWSVFFLVPVGRATVIQRLSADQTEAAFQRLWKQSLRQPYAIKTTEAPHYRRFVLQQRLRHDDRSPTPTKVPIPHRAPLGVNDGKGVMFIGHTGLIHPSGFLPIVCGMFPHNSVVDVYQNSPVFRALRDADRLGGKCGVCEYRQICGGGRARAFALTGDALAEEPDCAYVPNGI